MGKTTSAEQHAVDVVRLDHPGQAAAFRADSDGALRRLAEPALLDEWQEVPGVLGAVKRAVDADGRPGRFLLAGSVRAELEGQMWPATGRAVRIRMYGVTEREVSGAVGAGRAGFFDKLAAGDPDRFSLPDVVPDLPGSIGTSTTVSSDGTVTGNQVSGGPGRVLKVSAWELRPNEEHSLWFIFPGGGAGHYCYTPDTTAKVIMKTPRA